jgi:citrate lyase beta subunit
MTRFLELGASLYVPATRTDLVALGNGAKFPHLRSVIFCTEDAVRLGDVSAALANLAAALRRLEPSPCLRFVRVRSAALLRQIVQMDGVDRLTGFVLPKVTRHNLDEYLCALPRDSSFVVMPTLETAEAFDTAEMVALRNLLLRDVCRARILSLRIGGNDLLQMLGLRRPTDRSIYATPLGALISQLVITFRPFGFNLTGPVFEGLSRADLLARETRKDLARGLFGKSAIHPEQVAVIEAQYRVTARESQAAERILADGAAPVFRFHETMCEPATHRAWARLIHERARLYGVRDVKPRARLLPLRPGADLGGESPSIVCDAPARQNGTTEG